MADQSQPPSDGAITDTIYSIETRASVRPEPGPTIDRSGVIRSRGVFF
jgi:hypothetical protein